MTMVCWAATAELSAVAESRSVRDDTAVRAVIAPVTSFKALRDVSKADRPELKPLSVVCLKARFVRFCLS